MAGNTTGITSGPARSGHTWNRSASGVFLPERPSEEEAYPQTLDVPERRTLVAFYTLAFDDPQWGPVTFRLYVYRILESDLPEYEVVAE